MLQSERDLGNKISDLTGFLGGLRDLRLSLDGLWGLLLGLNDNLSLRGALGSLSLLPPALRELKLDLLGLENLLLRLTATDGALNSLDPKLLALLEKLDTPALLDLLTILKRHATDLCSRSPLLKPAA